MGKKLSNREIMNSAIRIFILIMLVDIEKPVTISEVRKHVNEYTKEKFDYKAIHKQVVILKDNGIVSLKKEKKKQGKPVLVTLKDRKRAEFITKMILKMLQKDREYLINYDPEMREESKKKKYSKVTKDGKKFLKEHSK